MAVSIGMAARALFISQNYSKNNLFRWDLRGGQKGLQDRIAVAHTKAIMALEWTHPHYNTNSKGSTTAPTQTSSAWYGAVGAGLFDDIGGFGVVAGASNTPPDQPPQDGNTRMGWLASGGLDSCVKVIHPASKLP